MYVYDTLGNLVAARVGDQTTQYAIAVQCTSDGLISSYRAEGDSLRVGSYRVSTP